MTKLKEEKEHSFLKEVVVQLLFQEAILGSNSPEYFLSSFKSSLFGKSCSEGDWLTVSKDPGGTGRDLRALKRAVLQSSIPTPLLLNIHMKLLSEVIK